SPSCLERPARTTRKSAPGSRRPEARRRGAWMSPALAQREVALAAVALLAGVGSLAIASRGGHSTTQSRLQPLTLNGGHWRVDLAGGSQVRYGRRTNCSIVLRPSTIGVTDPVLPCGVKLYLAYGNSPEVLTQVI